MPIYEYRCAQCGNQFEVIQKFSDSPLKSCPTCKGHLTKLISQTSFQLKGNGWYVTDYARQSGSKAKPGSDSKDSKKEDTAKAPSDSAAKSEPTATPKK